MLDIGSMLVTPGAALDAGDRFPVDFNRYRPLQYFDVYHHSPAVAFADQNAAHALQAAFFDADALADAHVGPWFDAAAGIDHRADRFNFGVRHGRGCSGESDDGIDPGRAQDLQPFLVRKPAEDVAG